MIIGTIIITVLAIIVGLILFVLFVPFGYSMRIKNNDSTFYYGAQAHWLFGIIKIAYNNKHLFHIKLFGKVIKINKNDKNETNKKSEKKEKNNKKKKKKTTRKGIKYLLKNFVKILKKYSPKKLVLKGQLGFEDPSITALINSITNNFNKSIDTSKLQYVYNEEVYNGTIYTYGRITLYYLVFIFIKLLLYKPTRQLIK